MIFRFKPVAVTCMALLLQGNLLAKAQETVARVGQTEVSLDQAKAMIETLDERQQAAAKSDASVMAQVLRLMLVNQLVLKEAAEKKFDATPAIKAQLDRAREGLIVESYLQSVSQAPAGFPSEAEIQQFYNSNAQSLFVPRLFQVSQVFVAAPKGGDQAAGTKKLADVQAKLKAPNADFAAIAKAESDAKETADRGGELGWVAETALRPELLSKLSGAAKGSITEPVQLDDGYHILKLLDTKPAGPLPLDSVRDRIVAQLKEQRVQQARRAYISQIAEKNPLTINELALTKLVVAQPAAPADAGAVASSSPTPVAARPATAPAAAAPPAAPKPKPKPAP